MSGQCPAEDRLACLYEGALPEPERAEVSAHVQGCEGCRQVLAALSAAGTLRSPRPPEDPSAPPVLDRYRILRELGRGAMGRVYAAEDTVLGRIIALKVVRGANTEAGQLLMRESRAVARLSHRNVITLHDVVLKEDWGFLSMECVDGGDLAGWLRTPRSTRELLEVFHQAALGLAAAHRAGLVHRDFKPANVLIATDGRVCVSDFGVARVGNDPLLQTLSPDSAQPALVGTPAYMAPEQWEGGRVTAAADQFSFFVALHEALAGVRPFAGESLEALRAAVKSGRRVSDAPVPPHLTAFVDRGLSIAPSERFASMDEVAAKLAELTAPAARAPRSFLLAGAALVAVAVGALLWPRAPACPPLTGRELVWGPAQRQAVEKALAGDPEVSSAVLSALDASAAGLDVAWADSCAGTRPVAQVARQQLCLADVLSQLDVAGQTLASVPPALASRALPVVRTLPDPAECAKVEALAERQPAPEVEPARTLAREGRVLMLEAEALRRLGRYSEALDRAQRARGNAEKARFISLQAEALSLQGRLRNNAGEYELASAALWEALELARSTGDTVLVGRTAFMAAFVECFNLDRAEPCARAMRTVEEAVARRPSDELTASLAELRAGIASMRYDAAEVSRQTQLALSHWAKVPQSMEDQVRTRAALIALGDDGDPTHLLEELDALIPDAAGYWGPNHPRVVLLESFRPQYLLALGRLDAAKAELERLMARVSKLLGPESGEYGDLLRDKATLAELRGDLTTALEATRQASGLRPELHFQVGSTGLLTRTGNREEARKLVERAEAELDWPRTPPGLEHLGEVLALIDYYQEAGPAAAHAKLAQWALAALQTRGAVAPSLADVQVQVVLANLALGKGDAKSARAALEIAQRAMTGREGLPPKRAFEVAQLRLSLLEGDHAGAAQRARAALEEARALGLRDNLVGVTQLGLAEALMSSPATLVEGCRTLREGLETLTPYAGLDVKAGQARLGRCPPSP